MLLLSFSFALFLASSFFMSHIQILAHTHTHIPLYTKNHKPEGNYLHTHSLSMPRFTRRTSKFKGSLPYALNVQYKSVIRIHDIEVCYSPSKDLIADVCVRLCVDGISMWKLNMSENIEKNVCTI